MATRKKDGADEATAYHEAGHAIAAFRLGINIKRVTIVGTEDASGRTVFDRPVLQGIHLDYDSSPRARLKAEGAILICLAGPMAQQHYRANSLRNWHSRGDYRNAVDIAMSLNGSTEQTEAYLRWLEIRARDMVRINWRGVEAVANALLNERTLDMVAVRRTALTGLGVPELAAIAGGKAGA